MPEAVFERDPLSNSGNRLGTDVMSALAGIPGVRDVRLIVDEDNRVVACYEIMEGSMPFDRISEVYRRYGIRRVAQGNP